MTKAEVHVREEWHLTGQPDQGYPFYDFTFRSDRSDEKCTEEYVRGFIERVTPEWSDVKLEHRTVTIISTEWDDITVVQDA